MIHTRLTIFNTLKYKLKRLFRLADLDPKTLKKIMYAVILNDMKEWDEYVGRNHRIEEILKNYLINNKEFLIDRFATDDRDYINVNTPQKNTTWNRIWDNETAIKATPIKISIEDYTWELDQNCIPEIIYYSAEDESDPLATLKLLYGTHGENFKSICEKMNTYIDRLTGKAFYLDCDGNWKPVKEGCGLSEEEIKEIVKANRGKVNRVWGNEPNTRNLKYKIGDDDETFLEAATDDEIKSIL